jgi:hypothetical protein
MLGNIFKKIFGSKYDKISQMIFDAAHGVNGWALDDLDSGYPFGYDNQAANEVREKVHDLRIKYGLSLNGAEAKADLLALAEELKAKGR